MVPGSDLVDRLRSAGVVHAEEEAALLRAEHPGPEGSAGLEAAVTRRVAGEPLEVVLGWAAFAGRRVPVRPGVFVPRRRTELLARLALAALPPAGVALELCCGTAAVAVVLAEERPHARVVAADVDPVAVGCARANLAGIGEAVLSDLYDDLDPTLRGTVDVVAANAPYVPSAEVALMPREARDHEPARALDGGPDGVDLHRRLGAGSVGWLRQGGLLLVETSPRQAPLTESAMAGAGLTTRVEVDDDVDGCVVVGRLP